MASANSIAVGSNILTKLQIKETAIILILSVFIPFLIHFLPDYNGIVVGAILLPMFWAPYIAVKFFKFHVGLIAALVSPVINYLITGNPRIEIMTLMTIQLTLFVITAGLLKNLKTLKYLNAFLSYIIAVVSASILLILIPSLMPGLVIGNYFTAAFVTAIPGIVMLIAINFMSVKFSN